MKLMCLFPLTIVLLLSPPAKGERPAIRSISLEKASRRYLGVPYRLFPLGEGDSKRGSTKPIIDERHVDCMTFVEQSLAHSIAAKPEEVPPALQRIRYRDGRIDFGARNHYFLADWTPNNAWLVEDVTARIGGTATRTVKKRLDRGLPARESNLPNWRDKLPAKGGWTDFAFAYIPSARVARCMERFPKEAIVAFVSPKSDMDASHVGLVFKKNGWVLRHASSTRRRVIDEPFLPYLKRRGRHILGVAVLKMRGIT